MILPLISKQPLPLYLYEITGSKVSGGRVFRNFVFFQLFFVAREKYLNQVED